MKESSYRKGVEAENKAAQFLEEKGFTVLAKRYKTKWGEIDIVAEKVEKELVFCEIKFRKTLDLNIITSMQQKRIRHAANFWLAQHPKYYECDLNDDDQNFIEISFAVLFITESKIYFIENAWLYD